MSVGPSAANKEKTYPIDFNLGHNVAPTLSPEEFGDDKIHTWTLAEFQFHWFKIVYADVDDNHSRTEISKGHVHY